MLLNKQLFLVFVLLLLSVPSSGPGRSGRWARLDDDGLDLPKVGHPKNRIYFFAVATRSYGWYCDMLFSAAANDIPMHIVGWGDRRLTRMSKIQKIRIMLTILGRLPEEAVAMYVDAFDVLFERGEATIWEAYLKLNVDAVIGCERVCYNEHLGSEECMAMFPRQPSGYGGLNSGVCLGKVRELKAIYRVARDLVQAMGRNGTIPSKATDQGFVGLAFDKRRSSGANVRLDCNQTVIQNMYQVTSHFCRPKSMYNCQTNTHPSVVHFNGNPMAKKPIPRWTPRFWWAEQDYNTSGIMEKKLWINDRPMLLKEVCPLKVNGDFHRSFAKSGPAGNLPISALDN